MKKGVSFWFFILPFVQAWARRTKNGPGWIRTNEDLRQRVYSPFTKEDNLHNNKDLENQQNAAYKPAYKKSTNSNKGQPQNLPEDLAEIASTWPKLSETIRSAIMGIVRAVQAHDNS